MDLLEIKKQHVSAYHWPSSGIIVNNAVRVLYNYCKRALVLGSHRLRQGSSTHGPRATDGPRSSLLWAAGHFGKITTNAIK